MAAFTVFIPKHAAGETVAPERIIFLKDEFSWSAFIFGPFWLAWRRAWIAALLWALVLALIAFAGRKLDIGGDVASLLGIAMAALLGFEGSRIVAWTLARKGYCESAVVMGDDLDEAETVFFHQWRPKEAVAAPRALDPGKIDERRGEAPNL